MAVAGQERVEVEGGEAAQRRAERRLVVEDRVGQERAFARRLSHAGVADDQHAALRPVEGDLAGRLAVRVDDGEGTQAAAMSELGVDGRSLVARELRVRGMDGDGGARSLLHPGRRPEVVAIGERDARHTLAREVFEDALVHLDRIDADVSAAVDDEVAVEIVAVPLAEPRPGEDPGQDLAHGGRLAPRAADVYGEGAAAGAAFSFFGIQYTSTWMFSRSYPRRRRIPLPFSIIMGWPQR